MARRSGAMTRRRMQVLEHYVADAQAGRSISLARIARSCGLYDYRNVRRIVRDLRTIGAL